MHLNQDLSTYFLLSLQLHFRQHQYRRHHEVCQFRGISTRRLTRYPATTAVRLHLGIASVYMLNRVLLDIVLTRLQKLYNESAAVATTESHRY